MTVKKSKSNTGEASPQVGMAASEQYDHTRPSTLGYGEAPDFLRNDEVYDEGDHAQWVQLSEIASLRERARELNAPQTHQDFDGKNCVECGDEMPKERLAMQRVRCVHCQTAIEEKRKRYA